MKQDNVIKILFVEDKVEDAEQVISLLRNHGVAVRPARAATADELAGVVADLVPDLVLVNPDAHELGVADVMHRMEAMGKDFAILALVEHMDDDLVVDLFTQGVHGLVLRSRADQLVRVVHREFDALRMRRTARRLKNVLRESERRCDALLASSRDPIAYVHEGVHVRANHAYLEIFGYDNFEDIQGLTVLDMIAPAHAAEFKAQLKAIARGEKPPAQVKLKAMRADGETFDASVELSEATFEGEACLQIVIRQQVVDAELREQLLRDPATDLFHRKHMLKLIDDAVTAAANGEGGQALLLVEPDNWKSVIQAIGMANTDNLMAAVAACIGENLGAHAVAGRMGERTIAVLLDHHDDAAVRRWGDALLAAAAGEMFEAGNHSMALTFGIGGSVLGEKNASTHVLLEQADEALRSAQNRGIGAIQIHDPAARDKAEAEQEKQWLDMVHQALESDRFVLYHQQIISLQDSEGEFSEILLRMLGPNGEVAPGYFLPVAERNGMMPAIDRWVIRRVIAMLTERREEPEPHTVFVKLAESTLADPSLPRWLADQLQGADLAPGSLVLEMPESKVVANLKPAQEFVTGLKALGVGFALEQFGSGLTSFQTLEHVDASYLKIDRSFMVDLPQHEESRARVVNICNQARELGKLTVAEWVEDATSTSILFSCGVDFVQGNFLREPEKVLALEAHVGDPA